MNNIDNISVVGVRIAERAAHINIEYLLLEDKNWDVISPNLDNTKMISGYSKIIPKLNIIEVRKPKVSLTFGNAVITFVEYPLIKISKASGAT